MTRSTEHGESAARREDPGEPAPHGAVSGGGLPESHRNDRLVTGVHHVAIAVHSIAAARRFFEHVLGLPCVREEAVPSEGVRVAFFDAGHCFIELLEPLSDDSSVARFLARRGEGIHHVALATSNIDTAVRRLSRHAPGILLDGAPRAAAGGARAAFTHPKRTFGALLELYMDDEPSDGRM